MKIVKLKKQNLKPFLESLSGEGDLWAPVKKPPDRHVFREIKDFNDIDLQYTRTILPPRKLMLPPHITMYATTGKEFFPQFTHAGKKILFGIHPCDINGLLILERFFSQSYDDPYFTEARKNTLILGHSCWPDEHCLCLSTHTHVVDEGYDLFFTDLETRYLVWIGSSRGDDLIRIAPELFEEDVADEDIRNFIRWREERDKAFNTEISFSAMSDLMELKYNDPLWNKLGAACLSCGSCSNVCPTCNCYNVMDHPVLGQKTSLINRCWDSCTLDSYSEVAGGENFREKRSNRLKLWYTHKLQAFISKYGKPACVGCGRCIATCPVDINIKTVAKALDGEAVEAFWARFQFEVTQ